MHFEALLTVNYINLIIAVLMPVAMTLGLDTLIRHTPFGKLNKWVRQIIIGVLFGGLAIIGTEFGIPYENAQLNVRDASVLSAGLMFGPVSGIIAGLIGGIERWFSVFWGISSYTRIACSVSTVLAGLYSAFLRQFIFDDKRPGVLISFATGLVMEVFHLNMVFLTHLDAPYTAIKIVAGLTLPMVVLNSVSVMLSSLSLTIAHKRYKDRSSRVGSVSGHIQKTLLIVIGTAFIVTTLFVAQIQNSMQNDYVNRMLDVAIEETQADLYDASDEHLLAITESVAKIATKSNLKAISNMYDGVTIELVDQNGIVFASTDPTHVDFNMASGEQSAEFLCLLKGDKSYVQEYQAIAADSSVFMKYAGVATDFGFVQVGYNTKQLQNEITSSIQDITKNRHIGETGYVMILTQDFRYVSLPTHITMESLYRDTTPTTSLKEDVTARTRVAGQEVFARYRNIEGYHVAAVVPLEEAHASRDLAIYVNVFVQIMIFATLYIVVYFAIKRRILKPVARVNDAMAMITAGDLDKKVDESSSREMEQLSGSINQTVDALKGYIDEAEKRMEMELNMAKDIQKSALPTVFPAFPKKKEFDIYALMQPAKEVGGDFYDFYLTHDDELNFVVADVSGKGIPAALFMMRAKTQLKSLCTSDHPLNEVFDSGNASLSEGNDAGMFVTAWQGKLNLKTGVLTYINAGHNPPLVKRHNGNYEYLKGRSGFVLAGFPTSKYKVQEIVLEPGDIVYLYTDGVTEAANGSQVLYGEGHLRDFLNDREFSSMQELAEAVKEDVDLWVGDAPQFDDITMVALQYNGLKKDPAFISKEASIADIPAVTEFAEIELEKLGCPQKIITAMDIAIDEIYSNIVRYGYRNRTGPIEVRVISREEQRRVMLQFIDEGVPYNPLTNTNPDITLSAEERQIGGLGIYMVKKTMDDVKYKYENDRNIFTIEKRY